MKFVWQISYPPANGASLDSYLVKNDFCSQKGENGLTKIALAAKLTCEPFLKWLFVFLGSMKKHFLNTFLHINLLDKTQEFVTQVLKQVVNLSC